MARFYGQSGCTYILVQGLRNLGLNDIQTLEDVKNFRDNFTQLFNDIINNAKLRLSNEIISLKNKVAQFIVELNELISNRRIE